MVVAEHCSQKMDAEKVKPLLRAVVQSNKGGVAAHRFNGEFRGIMGEDVPFRKLGFPSLNAFIETIPDTIRIGRSPEGDLTYFAVADASTAHIQRMVAAQKSNKSRKIRSKPAKGYLRKPAYKASWSTRTNPGMRAPQRPHVTRSFAGARSPQYGHPSHAIRSSTAHLSHNIQATSSYLARPRPSQNIPSQFLHGNLTGPRCSLNTKSQFVHGNLTGPRSSQNTKSQFMCYNLAGPRPSQNTRPQSVITSLDGQLPSRNIQNVKPHPSQVLQSHPVSKDIAPCPKQEARLEFMRNYAAPHPQQESTTCCAVSQCPSAVQTSESSSMEPLPETTESSPPPVTLQGRFPLAHITPPRVGRATVTKSRLFKRALDQATTPKKLVPSTNSGRLCVKFDRMKISPTINRFRESSTETGSQPIGLQITVKGQEDVPTEIVKYGKTYKIAPRFQRLEKQRNMENSDVQLFFNDDSSPSSPDSDTSSLSSHLAREDRVSLSITERKLLSNSSRDPVRQHVIDAQFKTMLASYLRKNSTSASYETACVGTKKNPNRYVSSTEIDGVIFGSLHVFPSAEEAEEKAAQNACQELSISAPKDDKRSEANRKKKGAAAKSGTATPPSEPRTDDKVKKRVKEIASKHVSGLWIAQLAAEYRATYWEEPPSDILQLIEEWTDIIKLEQMAASNRKIMYPVTEQKAVRLVQTSKMEHFKVPPATVPKPEATITVLISHLVDCSHFYVQCADSTINEIMEELAGVYEGRGSPKNILNPEPGLFCVAKYEDGNWYRALILAVHHTAADEIECEVMYVDFGNCDTVPASKISRILESLCKEPAQAIRCSLHGIFPAEGETWSEDAINFFFNLSMETELKMDVIKADENTCSVVLRNMTDGSTDISINRQMALDGVVASVEPPPLVLPENSDWPVLVTSVKMTTEVTVRLVGPDHSDKLEELEERLSSLADVAVPDTAPHVDSVYAVCTTDTEGSSWSRVRILSIKGLECEVTFLDHGDSDFVSRDALRPLSREMNQLPYQALSCKLTGLEAYEKDQKVIDCLVEISLGKTCIAAVDDRLDKVSLTLWDTSSDEDVNINETAAKVLKTEDLTPKLPERGGTIEVYVSCVTQQGDIYIQCQGPGLQQLEKVADHIEEQYGKAGNASAFVSSPQVDQLCIAKNSDSGNWYRAKVMKILPGRMVEVKFVDHGIIDTIHYRYLRDLPVGSDLRDLPYQAVRCQLYGLPPEDSEWTTAVLDRLTELMPPDELRVLEVVMGARETEDGKVLAQVEVYEIAKDGELIAVSETVMQEVDLWAENDVFEDAPSEPYQDVSPGSDESYGDRYLQADPPASLLTKVGGTSIATH